jgi:hypothetical protein
MWGAGIIFTPESPRFLLSQNKRTEAMSVLVGFRKLPEEHPYVHEEFLAMEQQLNAEIEAVSGATTWDLLKETFTVTEYRRRFMLMFLCHLFGQWSGANAITQYCCLWQAVCPFTGLVYRLLRAIHLVSCQLATYITVVWYADSFSFISSQFN